MAMAWHGMHECTPDLRHTRPILNGRVHDIDHLAFRKAMLAQDLSVWEGLYVSPSAAPSRDAKLCTYEWFARPDKVNTEPYYELPLPVTRLWPIVHFRMGVHSLPIEQGRRGRPKVPRHLRRCTFCAINDVGDKRPILYLLCH